MALAPVSKKILVCVMSPVKEFSIEHLYFGIPLVSTGEGNLWMYMFEYYGFPLVRSLVQCLYFGFPLVLLYWRRQLVV